jgi:cephalosporin-C deacetylase-like acetyl esterase
VRVEKRASKCARSARENFFRISALLIALSSAARGDDDVTALPKTQPLTMTGDLAAQMVDGVDRFLLRKTDESVAKRARHWHRDFSSVEAYNKSVEPNRKRLAHILGVRDERIATEEAFSSPMSLDPNANFPLVGLSGKIVWTPMTWPVFGDVFVEAILVTTSERDIKATVVLIPDADTPPEELLGLTPKTADSYPIAIRLADSGCQVVIMPLVDRTLEGRNGRSKLTTREWLHRSAYELGRTLTGYETQCALAVVDQQLRKRTQRPVGVFGIGEGGLVALYAAALDPRISAALVSGAFDDRLRTWSEPVERNVFGVLDQFGGAELASLVAPRPLIIEACAWPKVEVNAGDGGAPGILESPAMSAVAVEHNRARELLKGLNSSLPRLIPSGETGDGPPASDSALSAFLHALHSEITLAPNTKPDRPDITMPPAANHDVTQSIKQRQTRLNHALDRHNQQLLAESPYVRAEFMKKLDTSSPETYAKTVEEYRRIFYDDVIGRFDDEMLPANPRSRKIYETDKLTGYEVVLDVWSDVFAYGILVLPKDLKDGEKRPVVVCQHGLEGRPQDLADPKVDNPAYNQFALRLAERGFITFAPQNLYIGQDKFRTLQRKANPLGKTLFSIIVPQHQQITDWLNTLPFVDGDRIAFYGLSYGGKSAMRIPPLVKNYCLSICSADFNEWVWKNASTRSPYSYVWSGEYEIFEWDLGSTFNYAEMAALIAPRPFMVERGHFDGVAPDETVAYEFAKVRNLYAARLKLPPEDCQIEWFVGPHTIHGVGTFKFLHHHLKWPIRDDQPIVPLNK